MGAGRYFYKTAGATYVAQWESCLGEGIQSRGSFNPIKVLGILADVVFADRFLSCQTFEEYR